MGRYRRRYTQAEITDALTKLAYSGGNVLQTSNQTGISRDALTKWYRDKHREEYEAIKAKMVDGLTDKLVSAQNSALETLIKALSVTREMLEDSSDRRGVRCGDIAKTLEILYRIHRTITEDTKDGPAKDTQPADGDDRLARAIERLVDKHETASPS